MASNSMQSLAGALLAVTSAWKTSVAVNGRSCFGDGDEVRKRIRGSEHFQAVERE